MPALRRPPLAALLTLALVACAGEAASPPAPPPPAGETPKSAAYGTWHPTTWDSCTEADHDRYSVVGPDGKLYPTWHPPVDPVTGCTFGHEHGRDPHGSNLYAETGDIPFGVANEALDTWDPAGGRHEDHVGHKIEWENGVVLQRSSGGQRVDLPVTCDFLTKLHQGTHSRDAFANNLHELAYHVKCSDGTDIHATVLVAFGRPGEFVRSCDKTTIVHAGTPVPASSPVGGGVRLIPDRTCIDRFILVTSTDFSYFGDGIYENWQSAVHLRAADGRELAYFDPHFAVFTPSRFEEPAAADLIGRTIDACYMVAPNGNRARGGACDISTNYGALLDLTWDDPRSQFNGVRREVYFNQTEITNAQGPTTWYTDPFGQNARPTPFPGSVRQTIAAVDNRRPFPLESQAFGRARYYGGIGVHAPN